MWKIANLLIAGCIWVNYECITSALANCSCSKEIPATNWKKESKVYPELMELFASRTRSLDHLNGSKTLEFLNWQDEVLSLACPDTPIKGEVKQWTLDYFSESENIMTKEQENAFTESKYKSWQLVVKAPIASEYFAVYSCLTTDDCWHHFYVVTRTLPITTFPIHIQTGDDGSFTCSSISRNSDKGPDQEEFYINAPLRGINWKIPIGSNASGNIQLAVPKNRTLKGVESFWSSTIVITDASENFAGKYECVITDRFGVSSTPKTLNGVNLPSGPRDARYKGIANVHIRSINYIFLPIGIGLGLCAMLPLMISFCRVAKDEADLEEDDNDHLSRPVKLDSTDDDSISQTLFKKVDTEI